MLLRCQCRRLISKASILPCKLYSNKPRPKVALFRQLHTTVPRRAEEVDEFDEGSEEREELNDDEISGSPRSLRSITREEGEETPRGKPRESEQRKMTLLQIDRSMTIDELGLRTVARRPKRLFIRWLIVQGSMYEHFPQHIVMEIEERRVEKARKRAEDRMFARMNKFYNSLTLEEIVEGRLIEEKERKSNMKPEEVDALRPSQPEPTPFKRLLTGEEPREMTPKQIESKVLMLLKQHDEKLHTMYRNYIDWSDYQLQKRRIWFTFPDTPLFADVIERLCGPDPEALESEQPDPPDLSEYYGPQLPDDTTFPTVPRSKTHYSYGNSTPFPSNGTFKPWRPIPHSLRLKMFDAWREGLGLRNAAWLGGVSWRRAGAIIGIMKREWEFVQKVSIPIPSNI
jgi:hypothetical protein